MPATNAPEPEFPTRNMKGKIMSEFDCAILGLTHGTQQSPIDILSQQAFRAVLPAIVFKYPNQINGTFTRNPWDEEHPSFSVSAKTPARIEFGTTHAELKQIHFHSPSEHLIDSKSHTAEFHFVHNITGPNKGDKNFLSREPSTKIVLAVFFEQAISKELTRENEKEKLDEYSRFIAALAECRSKSGTGAEVTVPSDLISELKKSSNEYFHYRGSLTTGTYAEVVTWLVLPRTVDIPVGLPDAIKDAEQHTRSIQQINRRTILHRAAE